MSVYFWQTSKSGKLLKYFPYCFPPDQRLKILLTNSISVPLWDLVEFTELWLFQVCAGLTLKSWKRVERKLPYSKSHALSDAVSLCVHVWGKLWLAPRFYFVVISIWCWQLAGTTSKRTNQDDHSQMTNPASVSILLIASFHLLLTVLGLPVKSH